MNKRIVAIALLFSTISNVAAASDHTYVKLEDYWRSPDGDDFAPALMRVQTSSTSRANLLLKASGPVVRLECGKTYQLGSTVDLCPALTIQGCGMDASAFQVKGAFTPFKTHAENRCPFVIPNGDKASGKLILENFAILDKTFSNQTYRSGLEVRWTMSARNLKIRGFVVGVDIYGDATVVSPAEVTNANLSTFENVWVMDAQGPGLYSRGSDSNVIRWNGGSLSGNCTAGSYWASTFRPATFCASNPTSVACTDPSMACAGVFDFSFLGGHYLSPHTANNKDLTTGQEFSGYVVGGDNNRTTLYDPYSESFSCVGTSCTTPGGGNYMGPQVQVLGGHSNWVGDGLWIHSKSVNNLTAENEKDPLNRTTFSVGAPNSPGAFWEARADRASLSKAWRFQYLITGAFTDWYAETYANVNSLTGILRSADKSKIKGKTAPLGALWFPGPVYFGGSAAPVRSGAGPAPVPAIDDTWPDGSLYRRTGTSSVGGCLGYEAQTLANVRKWVCVQRRN